MSVYRGCFERHQSMLEIFRSDTLSFSSSLVRQHRRLAVSAAMTPSPSRVL